LLISSVGCCAGNWHWRCSSWCREWWSDGEAAW
jgi:hypothetical protein